MVKVRINGEVVTIPTIKGADGKSAYQYAVEAGFEGTEQEFINLLIEGTDVINGHLTDTNAHTDIRNLISSLRSEIKQNNSNTDIASHNTDESAHNDIRLLISGLVTRLNALADSDDSTLDQLSEIVTYIKSNKSLIDSITTNKVNVSDIVDDLITNASDKPVSAKQAAILKGLIDDIVVPTKVSQLENDMGYITQHQDLSSYAKKTDIHVSIENDVIRFSNGLTITCNKSTGEVDFSYT